MLESCSLEKAQRRGVAMADLVEISHEPRLLYPLQPDKRRCTMNAREQLPNHVAIAQSITNQRQTQL